MSDGLDPRSFDTQRAVAPAIPGRPRLSDPRDAFASGLDLPRGHERERVYVHEHEYELARLRGARARDDRDVSRRAGERSPR